MLQKSKRIVDQELLDFVKTLPCLVCLHEPSDPDHITSRGAGGSDTATNVWPLCRPHHVLRHQKGLGYMVQKFPSLRLWLQSAERFDILDKYEIR
jgi:5-methylcytosine-specific restriction endonuclease McrA